MAIVTRSLGLYTSIAGGATGIFISETPPAGQRCLITQLAATGSVAVPDIEIRMGGNVLATGTSLDDTNAARNIDTIGIGTFGGAGNQPFILGGVDETFEVEKFISPTVPAILFGVNFVIDD